MVTFWAASLVTVQAGQISMQEAVQLVFIFDNDRCLQADPNTMSDARSSLEFELNKPSSFVPRASGARVHCQNGLHESIGSQMLFVTDFVGPFKSTVSRRAPLQSYI
jgi:hypothetical protein